MKYSNVVVAGGGVLGSQIAFQAAYCGFNVTINSADKQQDYTINGYQIAVVVKEANGEFAKDKWIRVEKDEKTEYYYVDNDKGLALVIVDEPGTYEVCSYDNGNRIYYGTVTVTDKNVSCALTAEGRRVK